MSFDTAMPPIKSASGQNEVRALPAGAPEGVFQTERSPAAAISEPNVLTLAAGKLIQIITGALSHEKRTC